MADRGGPNVYSIAAHRGFADALVAGLIPRYSEEEFGLARLTLLLPSRRAARTVTEAFVRLSDKGMLLPRMAVVGDLDLDETLGPLLDPLGAGAEIPPAADPVRRWLRLAEFFREVEGDQARKGAALLRQAFDAGQTMDRLLVEGITPDDLLSDRVIGIVGELAKHWVDSTRTFLTVQAHWLSELDARGEVDAPARRNLLFDHAAKRWKETPPEHPIVAAGVTSASPSLAKLLRVVSELPRGAVILPDLDLALEDDVWDSLGTAGKPEGPDDPPFGRDDAVTHPQYHLKLLLNRMGIARAEIRPWHRAGISAAPPERSKAISNLFLPPTASARWVDLPAERRRLSAVRLMESAHPEEEAQAIAILIREALETPEKRVALVTPDRGLASRVVAQLGRWGIDADDTAGRPLPQTAAGRVLLLLAEVLAEDAAPVPLIALLAHPLVHAKEGRAEWLEQVRAFDLALRGPRPGPGLAPLRRKAAKGKLSDRWAGVEALLAPLFALEGEPPLAELLDLFASSAEALCGEALWAGPDGRALSAFVEELREAARDAGTCLDPRELHAVLRDAMDRVSVRPPWGGHPRVLVYGLLEARMSRADLVICGGLVEGVWPASPAPDALLPPPVLRALGVPGADFRIGLAAHDLAGALGAPEVVLSWALRDEGAPVIPSRFVLRVKAMLGDLAKLHEEAEAVRFARAIDDALPAEPYPRPKPMPSAEQRKVDISVTGLDRLRSDPYQFYANSILHLRMIDALDAEPTPAWKGTAVHAILERWHKAGDPPGGLFAIAEEVLDEMSAHPLMRSLWRPRLVEALKWIDGEIARLRELEGRTVVASEAKGEMVFKGARIHGRADRIDTIDGGKLAVVDYKTGMPPSRSMVKQGFSLQLGLIGMIAARGGFDGVAGEPAEFEYWSLAKDPGRRDENGFGYVASPFRTNRADGVEKEEFLDVTEAYLADAIDRWITGSDPFTARLNPDIGGYNDYDQLMRLDEWLPHMTAEEADEA
ncbi:MAG: PD-(D/E)XK nuclease family protein [Novosphingobium sp.]